MFPLSAGSGSASIHHRIYTEGDAELQMHWTTQLIRAHWTTDAFIFGRVLKQTHLFTENGKTDTLMIEWLNYETNKDALNYGSSTDALNYRPNTNVLNYGTTDALNYRHFSVVQYIFRTDVLN